MGDVSLPDVSRGVVEALLAVFPGSVDRGTAVTPPRLPYVVVSPPAITSEEGPTMGRYRRTLTYTIRAWGQATGLDAESGATAAEDLADQLYTAIERARLLPPSALYGLPNVVLRSSLLVGGDQHLPPATVQVHSQLTVSYERRTGLVGRSAA